MRLVATAVFAWMIITSPLTAADELPWSKDFNKSLEAARKAKKNVFIDFTGGET